MGGDLVVRTCSCRLNAQSTRPEQQKCSFNPTEQVRADRGKYLAAVFTIIKAYAAAKYPEQSIKRVNGFEQWSKLIQSALVWLGALIRLAPWKKCRRSTKRKKSLRR
jgi:putative DNA primase/helicase